MTKAVYRKRILVPQAKPGEVYAVQENADGSLTLSLVAASKTTEPTCHLAQEEGFTVAVPEQSVNENAIKELLVDFP